MTSSITLFRENISHSVKQGVDVLLIFVLLIFSSSNAYSMKNRNDIKNQETATFGAGCFWCVEAVFSRIEGVLSVKSGYSGGHVKNPTYSEVCTGQTGHAEVCRITFDPEKISYPELLKIFWKTHDPTTLNRQGNDRGTQYRSVIFFHNEQQKTIAEEMKTLLNEQGIWNNPIVTQIVPFEAFYPAEDYHHNYYENNPAQPYCIYVVTPKIEKFENTFKEYLKKERSQ